MRMQVTKNVGDGSDKGAGGFVKTLVYPSGYQLVTIQQAQYQDSEAYNGSVSTYTNTHRLPCGSQQVTCGGRSDNP